MPARHCFSHLPFAMLDGTFHSDIPGPMNLEMNPDKMPAEDGRQR